MIKLIAGGGLGDAALIYAKLFSSGAPKGLLAHPYILTHVEVPSNLLDVINQFYSYQEISAQIQHIKNWDWLFKNRSKYDYWVNAYIDGKDECEDSWPLDNPFPPLISKEVDDVNILLSLSAGRHSSRAFDTNDVFNFIHIWRDNVVIPVPHTQHDSIFLPSYKPRMMRTTLKQFVDLICSCNAYIGHSGFGVYLAAMAGKKVFCVSEGRPTIRRIHPKWNVTYINNLNEVKL